MRYGSVLQRRLLKLESTFKAPDQREVDHRVVQKLYAIFRLTTSVCCEKAPTDMRPEPFTKRARNTMRPFNEQTRFASRRWLNTIRRCGQRGDGPKFNRQADRETRSDCQRSVNR